MKIILSSPIPGEIAQLRDMLESAGIACFTRNEISVGLSPEIPLSESTPELWIQDDHNLAEALEIKRAWKASAPVGGSDWVCPACGETSEPQFSSCWKCGAERIGNTKAPTCANEELDSSEQTALQSEKEEIVEELDDRIPCVSYGEVIKIGVKYCPFCGYTQPYESAA
jgi:hypothetical protein